MTPSRALPDMFRPDAGTTLISEWIVGTPERQRVAAEALLGEWREDAPPHLARRVSVRKLPDPPGAMRGSAPLG